MPVTKPELSREYLYVAMDNMNFDVTELDVHQIAFTAEGIEPTEPDWLEAIPVDALHALFVSSIGESLAILVGPTRGDSVTTEDLVEGDYQVWIDVAIPTSDERVVRTAGILEVTATGA
jgi:hypothetical protein